MAKHTCALSTASPPLRVWSTERLGAAAVSEIVILSVNASLTHDGGSLWPLQLYFVLNCCVIRGAGPLRERSTQSVFKPGVHWHSVVLLCKSSVVFGKQADDYTLGVHVSADIS